jgi:general secretion pathway protein K
MLSPSNINGQLKSDSGVVLIAILWIFVALALIALSFSKESFVEAAAARNSQALEKSYYVARAGIAAAIYQIIQQRSTPPTQQLELQETLNPVDTGNITGSFGGGIYRVNIQDESGKINLNNAPEEQIRKLMEASGIDKHDSDIITDSILDWRDSDLLHRMNGAEDDYYETLNPPYKTKNGRFDTLEELLLVKGITPEYFYGYPEKSPKGDLIYKFGLSRCLTVYSNYSNSPQINVNFAPLPVLISISGMTPEAAQLIYERRLAKPFKNVQEITREIPVTLGATTLQFLATNQTGLFTLTASAGAENSKVRRVLRTVISLDAGETRYRTLYWNENVPDYEGAIQ